MKTIHLSLGYDRNSHSPETLKEARRILDNAGISYGLSDNWTDVRSEDGILISTPANIYFGLRGVESVVLETLTKRSKAA